MSYKRHPSGDGPLVGCLAGLIILVVYGGLMFLVIAVVVLSLRALGVNI